MSKKNEAKEKVIYENKILYLFTVQLSHSTDSDWSVTCSEAKPNFQPNPFCGLCNRKASSDRREDPCP